MNDPKTKDAPAFDFYPERWLAGVADMSDKDQLAYLRLLCHAWMRDGLPDDTAILTRLAGGKVSAGVMAKFPLNQDGKRRNARLEAVRLEQRERIASRRFGSAVTNLKRHGADSLSESDRAMLEASERGRSMLANASLSESLACRSATLERLASVSPPPTTHHPPRTVSESEPISVTEWGPEKQPIGCGSDSVSIPPVTIEVAKQAAPAMGVSEEAAESWWLDHDARGWLDGRGQPVRNWRSSLTAYGRRWQSNEARRPSLPDPAKTHGKQPLPLF